MLGHHTHRIASLAKEHREKRVTGSKMASINDVSEILVDCDYTLQREPLATLIIALPPWFLALGLGLASQSSYGFLFWHNHLSPWLLRKYWSAAAS
jgi:hypothetical protein